jgi:predicted metal-dependent HD superfamily phosphohydrolase
VAPELEARWLELWARITGGRDGRPELAIVADRYGEPARHYHTLEHVRECLSELDRVPASAARRDEAEMALWLHDVVYDPRASDNEARSAALAERMLADAGVDAATHGRIGRLIAATAHAIAPPPGDAALVCDADLAILGADPDRYAQYARQIGEEYAWVPAPIFRARRAALLRRFLQRRFIYSTAEFRERYESAARRNLSAELKELAR